MIAAREARKAQARERRAQLAAEAERGATGGLRRRRAQSRRGRGAGPRESA